MNGSVLYKSHPTWRSTYGLAHHFKGLLVGLFLAGVLVGLGAADVYSMTIGIILGVIAFAAVQFLTSVIRKTTTYTVTAQTVRIDAGILNRKREEFSVRKVQSIDVEQNIIERFILKTGNISLDSASSDRDRSANAEILFRGVVRPHEVADIIRNADSDLYGGGSDAYRQLRSNTPTADSYAAPPADPYSTDPYGTGERPSAPVYRPHPGLPPR